MRFAFVSNVSFDARLEDLKVFFKSCGAILSIVPDPHQSNNSSVPSNPKFAKADHKGRAYVEFRTYQVGRACGGRGDEGRGGESERRDASTQT